jgi:nucleoside-diphosphate-sugar epimerase
MKRKIVITGANGYVASHLISELLLKEYEVIALARGNEKYSAAQRMKNVLDEINENKKSGNLQTYDYSLLEEDFSMPGKQLEDIFSEPVDFFHFAASLKYSVKDRDTIFETNIGGVENAMKVFLRYSKPGSRFFFISSTYSCGKFSGWFEEKFYENQDITHFRNYYEQSKRFAENVVKRYREEHGLNGYVIRLSQVVGNNETGVTRTDYGVFDFVKRIFHLAEKHPGNTVRIRIDPDATQNLVPINDVVGYFLKIVDAVEPLPVIFNFAAKNSITNREIVEGICRTLPIQIIMDKNLQREDLNALERLIAAGMSFTGSYAETNLLFSTKNLEEVIQSAGNELTVAEFYKMLGYFIEKEMPAKRKKNSLK